MTEKEGELFFAMEHKEQVIGYEVQRVTDGLGFGDGDISHQDRKEEVGTETLSEVESIITSPAILVDVDVDKNGNMLDDDGCGDGRRTKRIFQGIKELFKRTKNRAKVFGGSPTMTAATIIGTGKSGSEKLSTVFSNSIHFLKSKSIDFGAHTDDAHTHGKNCGCGAIDKAPEVIANVDKYSVKIQGVLESLGLNIEGLSSVLGNFGSYAADADFSGYSGKDVMDQITESGKIVKELTDKHKEMYILLNTVEGKTVDQELIRTISGDQVQVFVVDVWRLQSIAGRLYDTASPEVVHQAFLSELVYTLGVAATLTKGDLPVYTISEQKQLAPQAA